ncbi:MAG: hypothetical protein JNN15_12575 [Blastocatellia bacterium]|nr:hypothetical protein [Blastocatellia bacterium]
MRVDRTWTISFEEHELNRLKSEVERINFPMDLGWRSILKQITTCRQTTLPLRALERLIIELDIVSSQAAAKSSRKDFQRIFPAISALSSEVNSLFYAAAKRSA